MMIKGAFINMALIGFRVAPCPLFNATLKGDKYADNSK